MCHCTRWHKHDDMLCSQSPRGGWAGQKFLSASALSAKLCICCPCSCVQARHSLTCVKKNVHESRRVMFMKNVSQNIRKHSFRMKEHITKNKGPSITMEGYLISGMCTQRNVSSYILTQQDICQTPSIKVIIPICKILQQVFLQSGA